MKKLSCARLWIVLLAVILAGGCFSWDHKQSHRANSLFKYLYPESETHVDTPTIPVLSLPLRVGIAFVPVDQPGDRHAVFSRDDAAFPENQRMALMKEISAHFTNYPFVKSIELIPTTYLAPRGGFSNLDQLRRMYGVDVMALLSYDQVQFTDQGLLSLTYWTVVGAYVVQGEKNDTRTMLDAAVYDIASRKLLFRAPGISTVKGSATPINLTEQLRRDSQKGFEQAATNMIANLKVELASFQERIKNAPSDYKVVHKPGYTGAAGFTPIEIGFLGAAGACLLWMRRKNRR